MMGKCAMVSLCEHSREAGLPGSAARAGIYAGARIEKGTTGEPVIPIALILLLLLFSF
jgi:hypothetical protein